MSAAHVYGWQAAEMGVTIDVYVMPEVPSVALGGFKCLAEVGWPKASLGA